MGVPSTNVRQETARKPSMLLKAQHTKSYSQALIHPRLQWRDSSLEQTGVTQGEIVLYGFEEDGRTAANVSVLNPSHTPQMLSFLD